MNQLRQLMLEELHRRNFAATTIRTYLHGVEHFSRYFRRRARSAWTGRHSPVPGDALHQVEVQSQHGHPAAGVAALLLYSRVEAWLEYRRDAYPKKVRHLPGVLSQKEVARLIEAAGHTFSSHPADDDVCHRRTPRRSGPPEGRRH